MKSKKRWLPIPVLMAASLLCAACGGEPFVNPGDSLGGGGTVQNVPSATVSGNAAAADGIVGELAGAEAVPQTAVPVTPKATISAAGDYVLSGEIAGKISVEAEGVTLYLDGASLSNDKKVIESAYDLTVTLVGENTAANTNPDGSNAIDCDGKLVINGGGSLAVTSTKNGISANSIAVKDGTLVIDAAKDGLHAEIDYDNAETAPGFSYEAGGWVVLDGAKLTAVTADDGIQADTFVLVRGGSEVHITTNGGAPQIITEASSDSGDGKGIKAGPIDWGAAGSEIASDDYLIAIEGGTLDIDANDDAIHSDGEITLSGGEITVAAGDDALHAEALLNVAGGSVAVSRCYEGLEAAKVEVSGGNISVSAADDGINAADGTTNIPGRANENCHIVISGGYIEVDAEGDGIDSNGSMLFSGGTVYVSGPSGGGNAALDADGGILVNGGYLFAVGPLGMVETPAVNSGQNVLSFARNTAIAAGTNLTLTNEEGEALFTYTAKKNCQSVILSCPELTTGDTFAIYGGDTALCTFTVTSRITSAGSSGGMNNGGGMPGGNPMRPGFPGKR